MCPAALQILPMSPIRLLPKVLTHPVFNRGTTAPRSADVRVLVHVLPARAPALFLPLQRTSCS